MLSLSSLAWFKKLDANFGLHLDHVGFEQSALCQPLIHVLCGEERDANFQERTYGPDVHWFFITTFVVVWNT